MKNTITNKKLHIKKYKTAVIFQSFFIHISSIENLFKKSELIFKLYFTIIRPKKHRSPGLFFDKVKFTFAGPIFFLHPYHVNFKQWTCLNLIFKQSIVNFTDIKIEIWIGAANSIDPGQTARVCRLAWLKTGAKALFYSE